MTELIKVTENNGKKLVSARELYNFLEVETPFHKWILRMFGYGFIKIRYEGVCYSVNELFEMFGKGSPIEKINN